MCASMRVCEIYVVNYLNCTDLCCMFINSDCDGAPYDVVGLAVCESYIVCVNRSYTTNPIERSASKFFRSMSEILLESSVESHERSTDMLGHCSSRTRRALVGILQMILRHFHSSSEKFCSSSARWD